VRIPVFHVDAFATRAFQGNPAAVCPLNAWLDDETLLKVAAENNLSETAFFVPREGGYDLRWFTPVCEVSLCGHATLASAYVLLNLLTADGGEVRFHTRHHGTVTVRRDGNLYAMDFPAFFPKPCPEAPEALLRGLGMTPLTIVEANETYIAECESQAQVEGIRPDFAQLAQLHPYAVSITAAGQDADFVSRYFAPSYGIPEDPVTGSAHCLLAPFWAERLGKSKLHARQMSERGGEIICELVGDRVVLKGNAVLTMNGEFDI
jgi:PhzF family phenazine biosynthesis protein